MIILVFSDSHGKVDNMRSLAVNRRPDFILHLGDCLRDAHALRASLSDLPLACVPGNCDVSLEPAVLVLPCEERVLFVTHGHLHGVKHDTKRLAAAARAAGAHIALFGHTHMPCHEDVGGLLLFNPGSISLPRASTPTYGLIEINGPRVSAQVVPFLS